MKKSLIFILQFIVFSIIMLFSQERFTFLDNQVSFSVPNGTIRRLRHYEFTSMEEYNSYYANNKISITSIVIDADTFSDRTEEDMRYNTSFSPEVIDLVMNGNFNQHNLMELLTLDNDRVALRRGRGSIIENSRSFLEYNGQIVGEYYGYDESGPDGYYPPDVYGYYISILAGNCIINIQFYLHDAEDAFKYIMPEYFYFYDDYAKFGVKGYYIWRYFNSRSMLYQKLREGDYEGLPEGYRRLRETLDMILETLYMSDNLIPVQLSAEEIANNRAKRDEKTESDNAILAQLSTEKIADDASNRIIQSNTKEKNIPKKTIYWYFLFLLIPFIFIILFLVRKRIKCA